jgi:hypothetical protein
MIFHPMEMAIFTAKSAAMQKPLIAIINFNQ